MYIKYTFVHFAILLTRQVSRAVPLPVTIPFEVEALNFRLGSSFGLLHRSGNLLAILLEVPFLSLALLLETSGFVNHQHLILFLISTTTRENPIHRILAAARLKKERCC